MDVTHIVQRVVDGPGDGKTLAIDTDQDLEALLGEAPTSSVRKHLSVTYQIPGHDAEQMTSSDEITSSGFTRNFIRKFQTFRSQDNFVLVRSTSSSTTR